MTFPLTTHIPFANVVRRVAIVTVTILATLAMAGSASAANPSQSTLPPQGLYEGCAPGAALDSCIANLKQMRAAGFRYVLNYSAWYGSPDQVLHYADAAQALGMKVIWPLNHPAWRSASGLSQNYPTLVKGQGDLSNPAFIAFAINLVKNHPATWGFYTGDEVPPNQAWQVAALSKVVRNLAPGKPQLYVARPGARLLKPFIGFSNFAGADVYPIGYGDPHTRVSAARTSALTAGSGTQPVMVLQAFSWSQYLPSLPPAYPTRRQTLAMRNAAIRFARPRMILWYSFQDIQRSDAPQLHWDALVKGAFAPLGTARSG